MYLSNDIYFTPTLSKSKGVLITYCSTSGFLRFSRQLVDEPVTQLKKILVTYIKQ